MREYQLDIVDDLQAKDTASLPDWASLRFAFWNHDNTSGRHSFNNRIYRGRARRIGRALGKVAAIGVEIAHTGYYTPEATVAKFDKINHIAANWRNGKFDLRGLTGWEIELVQPLVGYVMVHPKAPVPVLFPIDAYNSPDIDTWRLQAMLDTPSPRFEDAGEAAAIDHQRETLVIEQATRYAQLHKPQSDEHYTIGLVEGSGHYLAALGAIMLYGQDRVSYRFADPLYDKLNDAAVQFFDRMHEARFILQDAAA